MPARPRAFATPARFRAWLARNHDRVSGLTVRCFKTAAAERGVTYRQALDEALCFGWIDGVRHALDATSFTVRFTPRKPRSVWSRVNVARVEVLLREGRMAPPGLARFRARNEARPGHSPFEGKAVALAPALARQFRGEKPAWAHFQAQPPGYRRLCTHWVMSAKREETRA